MRVRSWLLPSPFIRIMLCNLYYTGWFEKMEIFFNSLYYIHALEVLRPMPPPPRTIGFSCGGDRRRWLLFGYPAQSIDNTHTHPSHPELYFVRFLCVYCVWGWRGEKTASSGELRTELRIQDGWLHDTASAAARQHARGTDKCVRGREGHTHTRAPSAAALEDP